MGTPRVVLVALLVLTPLAARAGDPPDPVRNALSYFEDARPEVYGPAIDRLTEKGDAGRLAELRRASRSDDASDHRERVAYDGVAYGLDVARRYAAAEAGSVSRWMTLDELMRSAWRAHVGSVLRRAGLTAREAARVLAERAQAELACEECFAVALGDEQAQARAVADAAAKGNAIVPPALAVLGVPPWLAFAGWPAGPAFLRHRLAVRVLTAVKAKVAIPHLLVLVDAPSAMLQFDVLHALHELTGDSTWAVRDLSNLEDLAARRLAWWKREGRGHADGARWFALTALGHAADFLASVGLTSQPAVTFGGESPEPVAHLFGCLEWLDGYAVPVSKSALRPDAFLRIHQVADAIRHFEGLD